MKSITRMDSHIKIRVNMTKVELDRGHSLWKGQMLPLIGNYIVG